MIAEFYEKKKTKLNGKGTKTLSIMNDKTGVYCLEVTQKYNEWKQQNMKT